MREGRNREVREGGGGEGQQGRREVKQKRGESKKVEEGEAMRGDGRE